MDPDVHQTPRQNTSVQTLRLRDETIIAHDVSNLPTYAFPRRNT